MPDMDVRSTPLDDARYRALEHRSGERYIDVLDQRELPHTVARIRIADANGAAAAIRDMIVRGAPLIGAVGGYGLGSTGLSKPGCMP
jgi:methylthioribose-1-phosphate isomerase